MTVPRPTSLLRNVPLPEPYLLGIAAGTVLHRARPWALPGSRRGHRLVGPPLIAAGVLLALRSVLAAGLVDLDHPDRLLTAGPYAGCRNPMYVAWGLIHLGVAVTAGSGWTMVAVPAAAAAVHREVLREEARLAVAHGTEFERYRSSVPRYLPRW